MDHRDVIASLTQQERDRLTAKSDKIENEQAQPRLAPYVTRRDWRA